MPRPFVLGVEIEEGSLGRVMRRINALPGVVTIHMDFDAKKARKPNGHNPDRKPPSRFDVPGEVAIASILNGKPPMTSKQLADAFAAQGRSPKSISSCLHKMRIGGQISSGPDRGGES